MIEFNKLDNGDRQLRTEIWLPANLETVFAYFSEAANLQSLTPPWLNFEILTPYPIVMRPGTLIDYRLRLRGIPLRWQSVIAEWDGPHRFVDRQVRGPYRLWEHEHTFVQRAGGTVVRDTVRYRVPGGGLVDWLFVRRDLRKIFSYRRQIMRQQFPERPAVAEPEVVST